MRVALLFGLFPKETENEIRRDSKGVIQYAADALQHSFVEGLSQLCESIELINLPYIGSYPLRYKKARYIGGSFFFKSSFGKVIVGENVSFCNLAGYKMRSRYVSAKRKLMSWCQNNVNENKVIVIYAIHSPFLLAAANVKKKFVDLKIILIVPDLPEYMNSRSGFLYRKLNEMNERILQESYPAIDSFVLLSKYMVERLPIGKKPWIVVEGIYNVQDEKVNNDIGENNEKLNILYTGTLAKRYGILNLVKAFSLTKNKSYRLVICGDGDAKEDIIQISRRDHRVIYKGQLPREKILQLQKQATLLVNPRTSEGEFTKYSFPSKTMEYFASGVPTLIYKLDGIPDEYFLHCYSLSDSSVESLSFKLEEILSTENEILVKKGESARAFILEQKNPLAQCKKVYELMNINYNV